MPAGSVQFQSSQTRTDARACLYGPRESNSVAIAQGPEIANNVFLPVSFQHPDTELKILVSADKEFLR